MLIIIKQVSQRDNGSKKPFNQGFSLLEIIIALAIIGFLSFGVAKTIETTRDFDKYQENKTYLDSVHNAFLTYVQVNGFLPCPDTDGNGLENRAVVAPFNCIAPNGNVPYQELGIAEFDVWGQPLFYAVNRQANNPVAIVDNAQSASYFNNQAVPLPFFTLNTPPTAVANTPALGNAGNYVICAESEQVTCHATTNVLNTLEQDAIAVVISFGKNGRNAVSPTEIENVDNDDFFWQASGSNVDHQAFDDQLFWLTGYDVKYAVIKSGGIISQQ